MTIRKVFANDPNPISEVAKNFALDEHVGGVPLNEQAAMVGAAATRRDLGQDVVALGGWVNATLLGTVVDDRDDLLILTAGGQRYATSRESFLQLTSAKSAGDTLIHSDLFGNAATDVRRLVSDDGTHSILLARTSDNRPLWQKSSESNFDTVDDGDTVIVYTERWGGGLLGQRINESRNFDGAHVYLTRYSSGEPNAPGNTVTYDGRYARDSSNVWTAPDETHGSTNGALYYAFSELKYNAGTARHEFDWIVRAEGLNTHMQFSTSADGPWHSPREMNDDWARVRNSRGGQFIVRLGTMPTASHLDRHWVKLLSNNFNSDANDKTIPLLFPFYPDHWRLMEIRWWFTRSANVHEIYSRIIRPNYIPIFANSQDRDDLVDGQSVSVKIDRYAGQFLVTRVPASAPSSSVTKRRFRLRLFSYGSETDHGDYMEVTDKTSNGAGRLELWVY